MLPLAISPALRNTVQLLRIPFSALLAPVYFLALSQAPAVDPVSACWTFVILHLLVYPASNGYNSYVDRDTDSIGGIERPPLPTVHLFYTTLTLDLLALTFSMIYVSVPFTAMVLIYMIASRLYSAPYTRLKRYAFISFFIVTFFQGAFACYMSMTGICGALNYYDDPLSWLLLASSLQIAGIYPITQIFQHVQDAAAGIRSLSSVLGYSGTFLFSGAMLLLSQAAYLVYFNETGRPDHFIIMQLFMLPPVIYFINWWRQVRKDPTAANYSNTMRLTWISACCMNACFILLFTL